MTGPLEIAFDMIQNIYLKEDQSIIGVYEAAMPTNLPQWKEQS